MDLEEGCILRQFVVNWREKIGVDLDIFYLYLYTILKKNKDFKKRVKSKESR